MNRCNYLLTKGSKYGNKCNRKEFKNGFCTIHQENNKSKINYKIIFSLIFSHGLVAGSIYLFMKYNQKPIYKYIIIKDYLNSVDVLKRIN